MRIACLADLHHCWWDIILPPGDVLVVAGDVTGMLGRRLRRPGDELAMLRDFTRWLSAQPYQYKIVVAGNHDTILAGTDGPRVVGEVAIYLQDSGCTIDGLKFWGVPWVRSTGTMASVFTMTRTSLLLHYNAVPPDTDVLICHGRPSSAAIKSLPFRLLIHGHEIHRPRCDHAGKKLLISAVIVGASRIFSPILVDVGKKSIRCEELTLEQSLHPETYRATMAEYWKKLVTKSEKQRGSWSGWPHPPLLTG